jgi:DivIVA domain-containing protein
VTPVEIQHSAVAASKGIGEHRFPVVRRGYDPEVVDAFLANIAEQVLRLEDEVTWQRTRIDLLERRSAAAEEAVYARIARDIAEVLRAADEAAAGMRMDAHLAAESSLAWAREEAERIRAEAQAEPGRAPFDPRPGDDLGEPSQLDLEFDLSSIELLDTNVQ